MIAAGICDLITVITWDSGGIVEYEGKYEVEIIKSGRFYYELFTLDNGDKLVFAEGGIGKKINFNDHNELKFKYSKFVKIFGNFVHRGASIVTNDNVIVVSEQSMKNEILSVGIIFIVVGSSVVFLLFLPVIFEKTISLIIWFHRPKKKKRKKKINL